jgi:NADH:ubiquinone oxidoreductase subunit H
VGLFFPYNLSPVFGIGAAVPATIVDGIFFLVKIFLVMFVSVMVTRAAMARFKIDQASKIYFISSTLVGLLGLILLWLALVI